MTREESRDRLKHLLDNIPKEPPTECDNVEEWIYENEEIRKALEVAIQDLSAEPCEDTISRQAVIDSLHNKFADGFDSDRWWNSMSVLYVINKVPPVQPSRPKGEWERVTDKTGHLVWECKCGWQERLSTNFCPNCGADMRGDENAD